MASTQTSYTTVCDTCLSFLDKHYPFYLLISGFLSLWRSGRHSSSKYKNSPAIWHEDIMHRIPARYTRKRRSLIAPTSTAATLLLSQHSYTPSPQLQYSTAHGTSIPGFISGGHTRTNPNSGGFYAITTLTARHNARMGYRRRMDHQRRINLHMNRRYGTNTYVSSDTWYLRQTYMTKPPLWLRDQLCNGNTICW